MFNRGLWQYTEYELPVVEQPSVEDMVDEVEQVEETPAPFITWTVKYDRDWTWVKFSEKPSAEIRKALKELKFRWSRKRGQWYAREHVAENTIDTALT